MFKEYSGMSLWLTFRGGPVITKGCLELMLPEHRGLYLGQLLPPAFHPGVHLTCVGRLLPV
jgi:hypothetical protein